MNGGGGNGYLNGSAGAAPDSPYPPSQATTTHYPLDNGFVFPTNGAALIPPPDEHLSIKTETEQAESSLDTLFSTVTTAHATTVQYSGDKREELKRTPVDPALLLQYKTMVGRSPFLSGFCSSAALWSYECGRETIF